MQARKSPRSTLTTLLAAAGIALAMPLAAHADPMMDGPHGRCGAHGGMGHGGFGGFGGFGEHGLRGLNLTEEQRDKIFDIRHAQEPAGRAKLKELREARSNLEALTHAPTYDEAKVRALTDKSATVMAELARMHARTEHQIYQILTPEQRKQFEERKAQREEMGPGMMRPGPGMRQG
jgi:Spy/CpxP family protein refolding chaperone